MPAYNVLPDSLLLFNGKNRGINRWKNLVSSVYLEKIREGEKINFDMDYLYFKNDNPLMCKAPLLINMEIQAGTNNDSLFSPVKKGLPIQLYRLAWSKWIIQNN